MRSNQPTRRFEIMTTATRQPNIGDSVICDGASFLIVAFHARNAETFAVEETSEGAKALIVTFENPAHLTRCAKRDLRWDDELMSWYLWGRLLSDHQKAQVTGMRDRGEIPARRTRMPGSGPAGGEHLNLYKSLFWRGKDLEDYKRRFQEKLTSGFADPDADDSWED
jgi:hypothetical protein